jgi:hypothetical protein
VSDLLHFYRCSQCHTTATTGVKRTPDLHLRCNACFRWMAFLWSLPIETDEQRGLAARGLVYNPFGQDAPRKVCTARRCDMCPTYVERAAMIVLPCVGKFCSDDCAQRGVLRHQQVMERVEQLYQNEPGLRPKHKELAQ